MNAPVTQAQELAILAAQGAHIREQITTTITQSVRKVPASTLCVPYVTLKNGVDTIAHSALVDAIYEHAGETKPLAALMAVFEKSDCPLVAAFRQAIAESYCEAWADDVAQMAL